jgi:hypothetical protein
MYPRFQVHELCVEPKVGLDAQSRLILMLRGNLTCFFQNKVPQERPGYAGRVLVFENDHVIVLVFVGIKKENNVVRTYRRQKQAQGR